MPKSWPDPDHPAQARLLPALGTFVRIRACGPAPPLEAALRDAAAAIARVERGMSFHRDDSALHALHRAEIGATVSVDPELWDVLALSRRLWQLSGGVFDPTVARALVASGHLPRPRDLPAPARTADLGDLELPAPGRARLRRRLWLDLGGIAKGYAVDRALDALRAAGLHAGSVNAGGDLACFGAPEHVGVRDPAAPMRLRWKVILADAALATSGDYFQPGALRAGDGRRVRRRHGSVSVIAPSCAVADGLTKVAWAAPRRAARLLREFGARAVACA